MEGKLARYYELKQLQKQVEDELDELRHAILKEYPEPTTIHLGQYKVKILVQERREYDDSMMYNSLPDPSIWRLLSKVDPSKVNSLLKLNIISDQTIEGTFKIKQVAYFQVHKQ